MMRRLAESVITHELAGDLRQRGYLYMRGLLDRKRVMQLRASVLQAMSREGWLAGPAQLARPAPSVHRIGSPLFLACIERLLRMEDIHAVADASDILAVVERVTTHAAYAHPRKMLRLTYPFQMNAQDCIPAHQDLYYVKGERDTLTAWIPLGDYPIGHGGLELLEGSHHQGLLPVRSNEEGRFNCTAAAVSSCDPHWCQGDYRAGDVLLFHSLTVHRSSPNLRDAFRISLDCRYSPAAGTINEDELLPPYHPKIPGWKELTGGWCKPERFTPPETMRFEPASTPPAVAAARPSAFCQGASA